MYTLTKSLFFAIFSSLAFGVIAYQNLNFSDHKNSEKQHIHESSLNDGTRCAHDELLAAELDTDPTLEVRMDALEKQAVQFLTNDANVAEALLADYTLPVVFHIIHESGAGDIPDSQVLQELQNLNNAFENTGYYDQNTGVNTQIEFCLAKTGPDGNPHKGITRTDSDLTNMVIEEDDLELKALIRWDPLKYINIYIVSSVSSISIPGTIRGYSYQPVFHGTDKDGIIVQSSFVGVDDMSSTVLVHQAAHYLGLYHTYQAGCGNDDCLMDGDRVCDTPPDWTTAEPPCEVEVNSCYTDVNLADPNNPFTEDQNDLTNNYLDNSPLECYNMFTAGQAARMVFFIENVRSSLLNTDACINDCDMPIVLSFTPGDTIIPEGTQLAFFSTSEEATGFQWRLDGTALGTDESQVINFPTVGTYVVSLTASNSDSDCDLTVSVTITVVDCYGNAHVDDDSGIDVAMCGGPGNPCKTIQYALDNIVCSGDTVFIHSGTYELAPLIDPSIPVALIPEDYTVTFFGVEDNGDVIVDGSGVRRGFVYNYSGGICPPSLVGNGMDAIHQFNFTHLTVQNTKSSSQTCTDGSFTAGGAALHLVNNDNSSLTVTIDDCKFLNNITEDLATPNPGTTAYGAIYFNGQRNAAAGVNTESAFTLTNSEFSGNRAEQIANGGSGGAICLFNVGSSSMTGSYFCENTSFTENGDAGDLEFNRNSGGAITIFDQNNSLPPNNNNHSINNCVFLNNSATSANGAGFPDQSEGGAIFLGGSPFDLGATSTAILTIGSSSFYNNTIESGIEHYENSVGVLIPSGNTEDNNPYSFSLGNDMTICNTDTVTIGIAELPSASYSWNTGATTSTIMVTDTGTYVLTVSLGACVFMDDIVITENICGEVCDNNIDDDGDGLIDCFDPDCCASGLCNDGFYNGCPDECNFTNSETEVDAEVKWISSELISTYALPVVGDIDGDGTPEVIVAQNGFANNRFSVINGLSGQEESELVLPVSGFTASIPAIADVDKDGTAEIFIYSDGDETLYRFEHDGTISANSGAALAGASVFPKAVSVADFDGDGNVEVRIANAIMDAADLSTLVILPTLLINTNPGVAADVLPDGACPACEGLELVVGNTVYSIDLASGTAFPVVTLPLMPDGIAALADVDMDGDLDGIVSSFINTDPSLSATMVYAWDLQTPVLIGQFDAGDNPSPATVADIDGDNQLEIVFKTVNNLIALDHTFTQKWAIPITENSANITSSIAFDFDGDGDFEIVDRDATKLRIIDGTNGNVMYEDDVFSITGIESPVIADVDGDGMTEILVAGADSQLQSNVNNGRLRAYNSASFPWQTTREVWNQYFYFNVNIWDNLTTPIVQQQHHLVGDNIILNNYLTQYGEQLGADATITNVEAQCDLDEIHVTLTICNFGENELSNTTPINFYTANPTVGNASSLDVEFLNTILQPDSCTVVEYTIPAQYEDPVFIVVNDDNSTNTPFNLGTDFPNTAIGECDYTNNMNSFLIEIEPYELDLGQDPMICDNAAIELNASNHFVSYLWQDGTTDSTFTAWDGGEYWVEVVDSCGGIQTDTIQLTVIPNTVNMTMPENNVVCPTQTATFEVIGDFDTYKWLPNDFLDCDTCQIVNAINPNEEKQYIVTASNSVTGCYSVDTVLLTFTSIETADDAQVCPGETITVHGNQVGPGVYPQTFTSVDGCDSTSTVTVTAYPAIGLSFTSVPTCPEGNIGAATVIVTNGVPINYEWSIAGVGNVATVSSLGAGTYSVTVTDANNCTAEGSVTIEELNMNIPTTFTSPTCVGDSDGSLEVSNPQPGQTFSLDGISFQASPTFTNLAAGSYTVFIQEGDCVFSDENAIVADPNGIFVTVPSVIITYPDTAVAMPSIGSDNPIVSYMWTPATGLSCTDCFSPTISTSQSGTYTLVVTDSNGCTGEGTLEVTVNCSEDEIEIPNVFTPNNDGVNDDFGAAIPEGAEGVVGMRIYNRWGLRVFESNGELNPRWDGTHKDKPAPADVYVYVIQLGCPASEEVITKSGDVTLVR